MSKLKRRLRARAGIVWQYLGLPFLGPIAAILFFTYPKYVSLIYKLVPPATNARLRTIRMIRHQYFLFMITFVIVFIIAFLLPEYGIGPRYQIWDFVNVGLDIIFGIAAIVHFQLALNCINNEIRQGYWPKTETEREKFFTQPIKYHSYPVFYGICLSYTGCYWVIWASMIASGIIGILLTFPTQGKFRKWERMKREQDRILSNIGL